MWHSTLHPSGSVYASRKRKATKKPQLEEDGRNDADRSEHDAAANGAEPVANDPAKLDCECHRMMAIAELIIDDCRLLRQVPLPDLGANGDVPKRELTSATNDTLPDSHRNRVRSTSFGDVLVSAMYLTWQLVAT